MKHSKVVASLLLSCCAGMVLADNAVNKAVTYFNARSQSANLALEMAGQNGYINRFDAEHNYSVLSLAVGYQQSFRGDDMACCIFGKDLVGGTGCPRIQIQGSGVSNRPSNAWLADYFGLATDFSGTVEFSPSIRNVLVDLNFYMGLDSYKEGMYFRAHIPFVHTSWELDPCEKISAAGSANHPFGYFSGNNPEGTGGSATSNIDTANIGNPNSELLKKALDYLSNERTPCLSNNKRYVIGGSPIAGSASTAPSFFVENLQNITYNDKINFEPLTNAKWACGKLKKNGVADLRFTLGYNAYQNERYHVGFGLTGAAPTGNRPHGEYLFEAMIGNGNHWELGGQFTSHYRFWQSDDEEKSFTAYLDANLTHLFKARQTRSFDLKNRPNSRYMLAQKLGEPCYLHNVISQRNYAAGCPSGGLSPTNATFSQIGINPATAEFKDAYTAVANLTTVDVDVNIGAQIDMALMFNYTARNWSFDFGYNLYARTCERIKLNCDCPTRLADGKTWALKGTSQVYGANVDVLVSGDDIQTVGNIQAANIGVLNPYPLGATQSCATINNGATTATATPNAKPTTTALDYLNNAIDSPRFASARVFSDSYANLAELDTSERAIYSPLNGTRRNAGTDTVANDTAGNARVMTSKNPIFLTENDLDLDGGTKALSHKVFGHVSYQWLNRDEYIPFLGFGVSGEFMNNSGDCCPKTCSTSTSSNSCTVTKNKSCDMSCKRCGMSQWSVWLKGGISYN